MGDKRKSFKALMLMVISVVVSTYASNEVSNVTKQVTFLHSPVILSRVSNVSDSGNSESRVNQKIITEIPRVGQNLGNNQKVVTSNGYQLEVIDDTTSEEGQERPGRQTQKGPIYPRADSPSVLDEFLNRHDYDDNSAKEDIKDDFIPKTKLVYGDIPAKADISKVRDLFVGKTMSDKADVYPSSASLESKYKLDYESPIKIVNSPIILKEGNPHLEPGPYPLSHPPPHLYHEEDHHGGHEAGYGHGFHHHQQKLKGKPLKPSVVYRDPSDQFDHHDKIRTLDKDHLEKNSRHPYGPHVVKGHEFKGYSYDAKAFKPEYYDQTKVPECAHKNKYIYNLTFCLDDPEYPTDTIKWAIKEAGPHAKKLLSDVTYQSADNLVTGLTKAEEEGYTYKHYFGATHSQNDHLDKYKPPYHGYTYSTDYFKKGGYICPSDIYYTRPKRAMNTFGKWKVIVNVDHVSEYGYEKYGHGNLYGDGHHHDSYGKGHHDIHHPHIEKPHHLSHHEHHEKPYHHDHDHHDGHGHGYSDDSYSHGHHHSIKKREYKEIKKSYTQTLRLEQCIYKNAPCSYIDSHIHSRCIQKHNFVRLVAWTHDEGLHVDTFKMPIACSCHVRQPIHFYHESGHHEHNKHVHNYHPHHDDHQHHPQSIEPHPHHGHPHVKKLY